MSVCIFSDRSVEFRELAKQFQKNVILREKRQAAQARANPAASTGAVGDVKIGDFVELDDWRKGTVRYIGLSNVRTVSLGYINRC